MIAPKNGWVFLGDVEICYLPSIYPALNKKACFHFYRIYKRRSVLTLRSLKVCLVWEVIDWKIITESFASVQPSGCLHFKTLFCWSFTHDEEIALLFPAASVYCFFVILCLLPTWRWRSLPPANIIYFTTNSNMNAKHLSRFRILNIEK